MRLIVILISTLILVALFMLMFKRLYPETPTSTGLDTSLPAVNRQVENLEDTTQNYNDALEKQQVIIEQNLSH